MTYIEQTKGTDPNGQLVNIPIGGTKMRTTAKLAANGSWSTGWLERGAFTGAQTNIFSDVSGSYLIEYSDDPNGATQILPTVNVPYVGGSARKGAFDVSADYVRFTYTNGPAAQDKFRFEIRWLVESAQVSSETLNGLGADTRLAMWTKTRIETKDSNGSYDYIDRTGRSLNVNVTNPNPGIVTSSSAAPVSKTSTGVASAALAANANRKGASFIGVTGTIYLALGGTVTAATYTEILTPRSRYEVPFGYTGPIMVIGAGTYNVSEFI